MRVLKAEYVLYCYLVKLLHVKHSTNNKLGYEVTLLNNCMKHIHHIIPQYLGGTDDPSNLIELTVEEHAEAHRLLYEQHGNWQDYCAWQALSGRIGREEILRMKQGAGMRGKKHSPEAIAKMKEGCKLRTERQRANGVLEEANKKRSESHKGKVKSEEHMANWTKARTGHKHSPETIDKIKAARALQKNVRGIQK